MNCYSNSNTCNDCCGNPGGNSCGFFGGLGGFGWIINLLIIIIAIQFLCEIFSGGWGSCGANNSCGWGNNGCC